MTQDDRARGEHESAETEKGTVVLFGDGRAGLPSKHELATLEHIAKELARLQGYGFRGIYDASIRYRVDRISWSDVDR